MTINVTVTLLMLRGEPDPTWTLTQAGEQTFLRMLAASPLSAAPPYRYRHPGYGGFMVYEGGGEHWIVQRGWIRGGVVSRVDEGRALEQWLLETGQPAIDPGSMAELKRLIATSG